MLTFIQLLNQLQYIPNFPGLCKINYLRLESITNSCQHKPMDVLILNLSSFVNLTDEQLFELCQRHKLIINDFCLRDTGLLCPYP